MKVLGSIKTASFPAQAAVVTIGNFDGIHVGHREIIRRLKAKAAELNLPAVALTFEPHPMKVLHPHRSLKNIFDLNDKIDQLNRLSIDYLVVEPFSRELSELYPESFFKEILLTSLGAKHVVVGHDFNFAKNRTGTLDVLANLCEKYGITHEVVPAVEIDNAIVSSSQIRDLVVSGNMKKASEFLSRPFYMRGVIEKGAGRGKKIGFPTANLYSQAELFPKNGVYVSYFECQNQVFRSLTNVGLNPTFSEKNKRPIQVETHILDFDRDIYGETCTVSFLDRIRDEVKFPGIAELVQQISKDVEGARNFKWPK